MFKISPTPRQTSTTSNTNQTLQLITPTTHYGGKKRNIAPPTRPHRQQTLPIGIWYETQERQFCQCHAFNMLLGHHEIGGIDLLAWCVTQSELADPIHRQSWLNQYRPFSGNFSHGIFSLWLFLHHQLRTHAIYQKNTRNPNSISLAFFNEQLTNMQALGCTFNGFLVYTNEPYAHASTLLKHRGSWYWLDSEKPDRATLEGMEGHDNLNTLFRITTSIAAVVPALTLDETEAYPFRPKDANHTHVLQDTPHALPHRFTRTQTLPPQLTTILRKPKRKLEQTKPTCPPTRPSTYPPTHPPQLTTHSHKLKRKLEQTTSTRLSTHTLTYPSTQPPETTPNYNPHLPLHHDLPSIVALPPAHPPTHPPTHLPPCLPILMTPTPYHTTHQNDTLCLTQFNPQDLRDNAINLHDLVTTQAPDILFIPETHIFSSQQKHLHDIKQIMCNYTLYFNSKKPQQKLEGHLPHHKAKGGVLLAVKRHLTTHPSVKIFSIPEDLSGYCVHISLPMPNDMSLHALTVYCPPGRDKQVIYEACTHYITAQIEKLDSAKNFFIIGGDFNTPLSPMTPEFQNLVDKLCLCPINASRTKPHHTHYPHQTAHQPSVLDDVLISEGLFSVTNTALQQITCSTHITHYLSDHVPLIITCPSSMLPILQLSTIPLNHVPGYGPSSTRPTTSIKQPIPSNKLETTRASILTTLST